MTPLLKGSVIAFVGATLFACALRVVESRQRHVREAPWDPGLPLSAQLAPDDDVVILKRHLEFFESNRPLTVKDVIDDATVRAVFVGTVLVEKTTPEVQDAWVLTKVACTIRGVIRTTKGDQFLEGGHLDFYIPGGEITIGRVVVQASDETPPMVPRLSERRSYLLFAEEASGQLFPTHVPLLIENNHLSYPWPFHPPSQPRNPMEGLTLQDVTRLVRDAKSSWLFESQQRRP